jgi:uncharacterized membrane protein YbhN (UPF0104 family)
VIGRRLAGTSWPLEDAQLQLVAAAAVAYLSSFVLRAFGWQRLFPGGGRPDRSRCLAACGTAAASGLVLPFRLDYVVKIVTLRRLGGVPLGIDAIALSIVSLGLVDAVAMLPIATAALLTSGALFRAPLLVVFLFCLGCVAVLAFGRRLTHLRVVSRSRRLAEIVERVADNSAVSRSTVGAGGFLLGCWTMRALGHTLLLGSLGAGFSPTLAIVVLCMSGAASILPITSGGAVVGVGATAGVLLGLGVPLHVAVNFSLASGLLLTSSALAAGIAGTAGSLLLTLRRRRAVSGGASALPPALASTGPLN